MAMTIPNQSTEVYIAEKEEKNNGHLWHNQAAFQVAQM